MGCKLVQLQASSIYAIFHATAHTHIDTCPVQLEGYKYASDDQKKDLRMRFFHTHHNIHPNHVFQPVVSAPTLEDRKPRVDWTDFHTVLPVKSEDRNHSGHLEELGSLWRTLSKLHFPNLLTTRFQIKSSVHLRLLPTQSRAHSSPDYAPDQALHHCYWISAPHC